MLGGIREQNTEAPRARRGIPEAGPRNPVAYAHRQRSVALWAKIQTAGSLREIHYLCVFAPLRLCVLFFQTAGSLREIYYRTAGSLREIHYQQPDLCGRSTTFASLRPCVFAFFSSKQPDRCGRSTTEQPDLCARSTTERTSLRLYFFGKKPRKTDRWALPRIALQL